MPDTADLFDLAALELGEETGSMIESLLLSTTRISTFDNDTPLTNATGFFFANQGRLFIVTSLHVLMDPATSHHPNRVEFEVHTDSGNLAVYTSISILLFDNGKSIWRDAADTAGSVDVAVIEIDKSVLPAGAYYHAFDSQQVLDAHSRIEVGANALIVGFLLGFQDTLHRLPVVRQAVVASTLGLRFQGKGYFLTDARTHRGSSGSPVITRAVAGSPLHQTSGWVLLGVHSSRLDIGTRDIQIDEALGLNCTWYADVLGVLTAASEPS
jgi:hypothetical protein